MAQVCVGLGYGRLRLKTLAFDAANGWNIIGAEVTLGDEAVSATAFEQAGNRAVIEMADRLPTAGQTLAIEMRQIMLNHLVRVIVLGAILLQAGCTTSRDWSATLDQRLPEYGHRNWIVVADSAYPRQSAPGIETIYTGAGQIEVLQQVLGAIDSADHVQPIIMLDAELESVLEEDAPGVDAYRAHLKQLLGDRPVKAMGHEDIIDKLDEGAELFNILLLKTDMTIPYTSVFIELDCGYWGPEKEAKLREAIGQKQ